MATYYKPAPGYEKNPILDTVGPNHGCVCGSGKKFKKCCQNTLALVVPKEEAETIRGELRHLGYNPPIYFNHLPSK